MSEKIDESRNFLAFYVGDGEKYVMYCRHMMRGDFAVDVSDKFKEIINENAELKKERDELQFMLINHDICYKCNKYDAITASLKCKYCGEDFGREGE